VWLVLAAGLEDGLEVGLDVVAVGGDGLVDAFAELPLVVEGAGELAEVVLGHRVGGGLDGEDGEGDGALLGA
jgi:hypothetical protein